MNNNCATVLPLLTCHAIMRMDARRLRAKAVDAALNYGRLSRLRGAEIYAVGRKEVERLRPHGVDLRPFEGVQVVCARDGRVLTVYRNRDFRGLKPRRRA